MALAVILLVGAALLIRTFVGLRAAPPGFDPHNVITMQTSLTGGRYDSTAKVDNMVRQAVQRIEALPGVESAAALHHAAGGSAGRSAVPDRRAAAGQWRQVLRRRAMAFRQPALLRGLPHSAAEGAHVRRARHRQGGTRRDHQSGHGEEILAERRSGGPAHHDRQRTGAGFRGADAADCRHRRQCARNRLEPRTISR